MTETGSCICDGESVSEAAALFGNGTGVVFAASEKVGNRGYVDNVSTGGRVCVDAKAMTKVSSLFAGAGFRINLESEGITGRFWTSRALNCRVYQP